MWDRYNVGGQQALSAGKPQEAERHFLLALQEAEKEGKNCARVIASLVNLANTYRQQGKFQDAEPLYKRALESKTATAGNVNKELVPIYENYAKMLRASGRNAEANEMDQKAQDIFFGVAVAHSDLDSDLDSKSDSELAPKQPTAKPLTYLSGFGNHFSSEALEGALPSGQNSPQKAPYGLYAEQLSGSSFTSRRHENRRSWLYRIRPSVLHSKFKRLKDSLFSGQQEQDPVSPDQLRWDPLPMPETPTDFLEGLATIATNGNTASYRGFAVLLYAVNQSMINRFFYNADAEMIFVPQLGTLELRTEFGDLHVGPGEIAVIQRGIRFQVNILEETARGYVGENFGAPFRLPNLGLIGANGLANVRDFLTPTAKFEDKPGDYVLIAKFQGSLWESTLTHSPLNVVAWHGNYAPYKYDLSKFQAINSVSFDHSDPSIFTVLTSPSEVEDVANCDFVIFPPRWLVSEHTFRPPYFHRNLMSEYMGLIRGQYDAKQRGFVPGGGSLHNCMSAHGPDGETFLKASTSELSPTYIPDSLAFMFESSLVFKPTTFALSSKILQPDYLACWQGLTSHFTQAQI